MASLDSLPADQRAVLALVLGRGRGYDEIGRMLSIDRAAVRQRALAAFDSLGPQTRVPPERRALITDYLLGQLPAGLAEETRSRLADSAGERAWARVLSSELAPLASGPLPDISIPGSAPAPATPVAEASAQAPVAARPAPPKPEPEPEPEDDDDQFDPEPGTARNVSRRGGAVLIAIVVVAVIAVVVIVISLASSDSGHRSSRTTSAAGAPTAATTTTAASSTTTSSGSAQVVAQINLTAPNPASKAAGIAEVLRQGTNDGIAIVAQKIAPNTTKPANAYAVWLYNSPTDAHILGFVNPGVGANGRLSTAGGLPSNASHYKQLIITLETQATPKTPGTIILQGPLKGL